MEKHVGTTCYELIVLLQGLQSYKNTQMKAYIRH